MRVLTSDLLKRVMGRILSYLSRQEAALSRAGPSIRNANMCFCGGLFPQFLLRIDVQVADREDFCTQNGQVISPSSYLTGWASWERSERKIFCLFQKSTPHSVPRRLSLFAPRGHLVRCHGPWPCLPFSPYCVRLVVCVGLPGLISSANPPWKPEGQGRCRIPV